MLTLVLNLLRGLVEFISGRVALRLLRGVLLGRFFDEIDR